MGVKLTSYKHTGLITTVSDPLETPSRGINEPLREAERAFLRRLSMCALRTCRAMMDPPQCLQIQASFVHRDRNMDVTGVVSTVTSETKRIVLSTSVSHDAALSGWD